MILSTNQLLDCPVMSLQTGKEVARASEILVNPDNFKIVGFVLKGDKLDLDPSILRIEDIRELSDIGFIVDSSDEFIGTEDVLKIKKIYDKNFELVGMNVVDDLNHKLGKIDETFFSTETFEIVQFSIMQPFFKRISESDLLISQNQVIDVKDDTIVVASPKAKASERKSTRRRPHSSKKLATAEQID